jgi:hypothetical protein
LSVTIGRLLKKKLLLAGIAALFLATGAAHAANITSFRNPDGDILYIDVAGDIKSGDDVKFSRLINTRDLVIVRLTSDGGDLIAGLNIGEPIHAHDTITLAVKNCASVCGLIWLAGKTRNAWEDSTIGFHAAYYEANGQITAEGNAMVGAYLSRLGFSYAAIKYLTSAPPNSIQWLDCKALDQYGIKAQILGTPGTNRYPCIEGQK